MKKVCVITGGGSGIGLAAAKFLPKEKVIVLTGRTMKKLKDAVSKLQDAGYESYAMCCDVSKRAQVAQLAEFASKLGTITNVIHAAGISPSMADPETILRINALGTLYVNQEFSKHMEAGSVIVDVASNSAYALPQVMIDTVVYALSEESEEQFLQKMLQKSEIAPDAYHQSGIAYSLSKNFAIWYAKKCAFDYGERGIRVVSLSPGLIDTDMGQLEAKEGAQFLQFAAQKRMGSVQELGFALASLADERNGYLAGVDVLCDGGATSGREFRGMECGGEKNE